MAAADVDAGEACDGSDGSDDVVDWPRGDGLEEENAGACGVAEEEEGAGVGMREEAMEGVVLDGALNCSAMISPHPFSNMQLAVN